MSKHILNRAREPDKDTYVEHTESDKCVIMRNCHEKFTLQQKREQQHRVGEDPVVL